MALVNQRLRPGHIRRPGHRGWGPAAHVQQTGPFRAFQCGSSGHGGPVMTEKQNLQLMPPGELRSFAAAGRLSSLTFMGMVIASFPGVVGAPLHASAQ